MQVILTKNVPELGSEGDVLDVADGYARNYLVPKALAVRATAGAVRQADGMRRARLEAERKVFEEAERLAQSLVGSRVVVAARAGDEGKLFGSVSTRDVVKNTYDTASKLGCTSSMAATNRSPRSAAVASTRTTVAPSSSMRRS